MTQKTETESEKVYIDQNEANQFVENGQIYQELFKEARKSNSILTAFRTQSDIYVAELFKKYAIEGKQVVNIEKDDKGIFFVVKDAPKTE